jgi:DNA repair exonuclease SbcCD ATPase subunit
MDKLIENLFVENQSVSEKVKNVIKEETGIAEIDDAFNAIKETCARITEFLEEIQKIDTFDDKAQQQVFDTYSDIVELVNNLGEQLDQF